MRPSERASRFTESVIREMTRVALSHGAVNLSQGFPDFPAPDEVKAAAMRAVSDDVNQYAVTWGAPSLRSAIGENMQRHYGVAIEPDRQVTVCCGSTEAMIATLLATVEVALAKVRLFRVPELMAGSFVLAFLAVTASYLVVG